MILSVFMQPSKHHVTTLVSGGAIASRVESPVFNPRLCHTKDVYTMYIYIYINGTTVFLA